MKSISDISTNKTASSSAKGGKKAAKKQPKAAERHIGRRWIVASAVAAVLLAVTGSTGLAVAHYSDKILPGVSVAGVPLGGKTPAQAEALLQQKVSDLDVIVQNADTSWKPTPSELGVDYDLAGTVQAAYNEGRTGPVGQRLNLVSGVQLPLEYHYNSALTDSYIYSIIHATSKDAVNATLAVQNGVVQIVPEQVGQTTGVEDAPSQIRGILGHPGPLVLTVSQIKLNPQITAADLAGPLSQARTMSSLPVTITANGKNIGPTPAQEASWLTFTPDPTTHTITTAFNTAKIQAFVASAAKSYDAVPVTQEVGVEPNNAGTLVVQAGSNGQDLTNQTALSEGLVAALTAGKPFAGVATVTTTPFTSKQMTIYPQWIDINLTTQTMTAYDLATPVLHVLISSGIPMFPTPTGTFHIFGKVASTLMTGDAGTPYYYYLPNVQWVSWWNAGGYAIHGTYWHHNFGHVMSHGCINATNADAKFIYDWAPIGTPVVIHD